jgi:hypothetical protein
MVAEPEASRGWQSLEPSPAAAGTGTDGCFSLL